MIDALIEIVKRNMVEDADSFGLENVQANQTDIKKIELLLEQIIKVAKRIVARIEKDRLLDSRVREKIISKAMVCHDTAVKVLSKIEGLEVDKGTSAIKLINRVIDDCRELNRDIKANI